MDDKTKELLDRAQGVGRPDPTQSRDVPSTAPTPPPITTASPAVVPQTPPTTQQILSASNIHKTYRLGKVDVPVLRGASIDIHEGELVAILGASGSGKSTLLHILGGLDTPDTSVSKVVYAGAQLSTLSQGALNKYRNKDVGFVFQFYHLLPELSVLQNALIPAMMGKSRLAWTKHSKQARQRAEHLLDLFGLSARLKHKPSELSGGERQRVAIARALINQPTLLLADEPTGNLDRKTGDAILDALIEARNTTTKAMVIVTHDAQTAARADRVVTLQDGQVVHS